MILLACGGRDYNDRAAGWPVLDAVHAKRPIQLLIHGAAPGADHLAAAWAIERGIPALAVPARWHDLGNRAGPDRNRRMLEGILAMKPDGVIAFPGGRGTTDMVRQANAAGVTVYHPFPPRSDS